MKVKLIWAYLPNSSGTIRVSTQGIIDLIQTTPTHQLEKLFNGINKDLDLFGDDERREEMNKYLKGVNLK